MRAVRETGRCVGSKCTRRTWSVYGSGVEEMSGDWFIRKLIVVKVYLNSMMFLNFEVSCVAVV